MIIGSALALAATLAMGVASALYPKSIYALMLPMIFFTTALGMVLPHAMAIALRPFAHIAGTASAFMGFIQMALSAGISAVVGQYLTDTPRPMLFTMVLVSLLALGPGTTDPPQPRPTESVNQHRPPMMTLQ